MTDELLIQKTTELDEIFDEGVALNTKYITLVGDIMLAQRLDRIAEENVIQNLRNDVKHLEGRNEDLESMLQDMRSEWGDDLVEHDNEIDELQQRITELEQITIID